MRMGLMGLALGFAALAAGPAGAADVQAGRQKVAGLCQACHGMDGLSKNPEAPNLAGQIENYLAKSLNEYRTGERKNESMNIVAKELTDDEIANVSAFYASIQVDVIPP
ncbi:c-type cytochrome [Microvirga pudoricolor]|uniref:c-type cytochrome n=1 Tax=Microvirga pudoricolor TaxID=2778729 RepID=UPI0019512319|nr:cytochrome c [Microvirga pudoricolor]MBM6594296.1 cytochrome c [Microvirga pudoricolor]